MKKAKNIVIKNKGWVVFLILIGIVAIVVGTTLSIKLNKKDPNLSDFNQIGVYLDAKYYKGEILKNSKRVNLTKDLEKYKNQFNGYTTNDDFSRVLNAVELRNGDSLLIKLDKSKIDNWQNYIQWMDTLLVKYPQNLSFVKKENETIWESNAEVAYAYPKDMVDSVRNRQGSCFSKSFYDSLSTNNQQLIKNSLQYNTLFFKTHTNNRVDSLDDLNSDEWSSIDKSGNGFSCFQKIKQSSVIVKKISNDSLLFTWDGYSDFTFLENNLYPKYGMNYSYLRFKDDEKNADGSDKWYFATGILFSNLNKIRKTKSSSLTYFDEQFRKSTSGLFTKYDKEINKDVDSNWKLAINAYGVYDINQYLDKSKTQSYFRTKYSSSSSFKIMFKVIDKSFSGLYQDNTFYDWFKS